MIAEAETAASPVLLLGKAALRYREEARGIVEKAEAHLLDFVEQGWHVLEPANPFVPGIHIEAICLHLEAVSKGWIRNLLINVPPRHGKSLLASVFWPAWVWTRKPEHRWLFASYAESLSIRDSVKCRRLIQSPWYQRHWGDRFRLTGEQNEKKRYDNDHTGYRLATSVDGANTGEGGDSLVIDDAHNVKERESDIVREGVITWWNEVMPTRLNNPRTGTKVVIGQRVHERDISGWILEQGGFEHLCLPAEYEEMS